MKNSVLYKININQFKIFESVYRLRSMTLAAQELFLTQSGVSQHIKKLEVDLNKPLFVRTKNELFTTFEGDELYKACSRLFSELNVVIENLNASSSGEQLGTIKIGVPTEFGNNILIPLIAKWSKTNPNVKFDIVYGYGAHLSELLEAGNLEIAFIDSFRPQKNILNKVVYQENLNLVTSEQYLKNKRINPKLGKMKINHYEMLDYIEYEYKESILRLWFQNNFGKKNVSINIKVWAMNVQGVSSFVRQGMGVAVLPHYMVEKIIKEGTELHIFKGTNEILKNEISLAWLKHKPLSRAAVNFKEFILGQLTNSAK